MTTSLFFCGQENMEFMENYLDSSLLLQVSSLNIIASKKQDNLQIVLYFVSEIIQIQMQTPRLLEYYL